MGLCGVRGFLLGREVEFVDARVPGLLLGRFRQERVLLLGGGAEDDWLDEGFLLVEGVFCSGSSREEGDKKNEARSSEVSVHLFKR